MDKNGYNESMFITESGTCLICRRKTDTARHEIYHGTANRKLSKEHGMWVNVCPECHRKLHEGGDLDRWLKKFGQFVFESGRTREEFIEIFGRNYL